jgi:hypothetical protein
VLSNEDQNLELDPLERKEDSFIFSGRVACDLNDNSLPKLGQSEGKLVKKTSFSV